MVKAVQRAVEASWHEMEDKQGNSLSKDVQQFLLGYVGESPVDFYAEKVREEQPTILALSRSRFPAEPPTGAKLKNIRQMMLRIHKASGHASMSSLRKMLQMRGAPTWAQELAEGIQCPDCAESKRPRPAPPASMGSSPALWEQVGTDVFEMEFTQTKDEVEKTMKAKFVIWRDRASGLTVADLLQIYDNNWEPKTIDLTRSFSKYLALNPAPIWVISDPAAYYTSHEWLDYFGRSGIGVLTAPAEAHWVMGAEEATIGALKATMRRLLKELPDMDIEELMHLATHAHNSAIGTSGFSPFQWTRGQAMNPEFPVGLNPSKAYGGVLKLKEKAKVAFEMESAKIRMSKLNNTVTRPSAHYKTGALVMLWRQRMRPGKVSGSWVGPLRMLLHEGSTLWLATGSSIIKAKLNQVRAVTRREELMSSLEGTAVYKLPITMETLMKEFTGKHYTDVTGENPSTQQLQQDLSPTEVQVEPQSRHRQDTWRVEPNALVRVHNVPRLALFTPSRVSECPLPEAALTGKRTTVVRPIAEGADEVTITDDYHEKGNRALQDRWIGETRFERKQPPRPAKMRRRPEPRGAKRKPEDQVPLTEGDAEDQPPDAELQDAAKPTDGGAAFPSVPESLTQALHERGPNAVDGVPAEAAPSTLENHCPVPECQLPGGHDGPHMDSRDRRYTWSPYNGKIIAEDVSSSSSSSNSSDSEEMIPDKDKVDKSINFVQPDDVTQYGYQIEFELTLEDAEYLSRRPKKAAIWMSTRMQEKGKEAEWKHLTLEQKMKFDEAQALELNNVMKSKALRSLSESELSQVNPKSIMQMRWVLTFKPPDDRAKARLVVLGYQAPNLTSTQTSSPTMSRTSRNVLLALTAIFNFEIRAGDVTAAFLQADQDMSDQGLYVWAPAELASLFGADPGYPVKVLQVMRAFYGLCHSPRAWFEHVVQTMLKIGWRQLLSDRCVFVLMNESGLICGLAGLHVDDFLISGNESDPTFTSAMKQLEGAYTWGKWEHKKFTFAGIEVNQAGDGSIRIGQEDYTNKWMQEVELSSDRAQMMKSSATNAEISQLRGLIGTAAWRCSQTSPQFSADVGLLLSEIPYATVSTLVRANKLLREMRREASQTLLFPSGYIDWRDLAVIGWADASQKNRPDGSSTLGMVVGLGHKGILDGTEHPVALLCWKSAKTPRQALGSNGVEIQAVTETEDAVFRIRGLLVEIFNVSFDRTNLDAVIRDNTHGAVVMDTRGIFDAATRNMSSLHGLRSSRAGYELALAVVQAVRSGCRFRWVHGGAQLGDSLTKSQARKVLLQFLANGQRWKLVHDPKFESGRKVRKRELEKIIREAEVAFVSEIGKLAQAQRWPWDLDSQSLRMWCDALSESIPCSIQDIACETLDES